MDKRRLLSRHKKWMKRYHRKQRLRFNQLLRAKREIENQLKTVKDKNDLLRQRDEIIKSIIYMQEKATFYVVIGSYNGMIADVYVSSNMDIADWIQRQIKKDYKITEKNEGAKREKRTFVLIRETNNKPWECE